MQGVSGHIQDMSRDTIGEASLMVERKVSYGFDISHRQKLVKLADSFEHGR